MPAYALVGAPAKTFRKMARQKFLKLLRLMKYAKESNLQAIFVCPACKQPAKLQRGEGLITLTGPGAVNEKTDVFSIACSCTTWTVGR